MQKHPIEVYVHAFLHITIHALEMQCGDWLPLKQDVQHLRMLMHKSDAWAIGIAIHPEDAATHLHKQPGTAIRHPRSDQPAA